MAIVIPEIEKLRGKDPDLFTALNKVVEALNSVPVLGGIGSPEGQISAPAGTIYSRRDPLMGESVYVKSTADGNTGWVPVNNAASGLLRVKRTLGGPTSAAAFTKVNGDDQIVVPPTCHQMSFNLVFTGSGKARIKIGANISNEVTATGTVTVNGLLAGKRLPLRVEALATSGSVTANLEVIETTTLSGSQLVGGTASPGSSPPPPPDPPEEPPEEPQWGEGPLLEVESN